MAKIYICVLLLLVQVSLFPFVTVYSPTSVKVSSRSPKLDLVAVNFGSPRVTRKLATATVPVVAGECSCGIIVGVIHMSVYIYPKSFPSIDLEDIKKVGPVGAAGYTSVVNIIVRSCYAAAEEARYNSGPHVVSVGDANIENAEKNAATLNNLSQKPIEVTLSRKVSRAFGLFGRKTERVTTMINPKVWWQGVRQGSRCPTAGYGHDYLKAANSLSKSEEQGKFIRQMAQEFIYQFKDHGGLHGLVLNTETHGGCFPVNKAYLTLAFEELKPSFQVRLRPIPTDPPEVVEFRASLALDLQEGVSNRTLEVIRDNNVGNIRDDYSLVVRPILAILMQYGSTDFMNILKEFRRMGPFVSFEYDVVEVPLRATKRETTIDLLGKVVKRTSRRESRKEDALIVNFVVDRLSTKPFVKGSPGSYNPFFLYGPLELELFEDITEKAKLQGGSRTFHCAPCGTPIVEKGGQRCMQIFVIKPILGADAVNLVRNQFSVEKPVEEFISVKEAFPEETLEKAIRECPNLRKSAEIGSRAIDVDIAHFLREARN